MHRWVQLVEDAAFVDESCAHRNKSVLTAIFVEVRVTSVIAAAAVTAGTDVAVVTALVVVTAETAASLHTCTAHVLVAGGCSGRAHACRFLQR